MLLVCSKFPANYVSRIPKKEKYLVNNKLFITSDLAEKLLERAKSKTAKEFLLEYRSDSFAESDNNIVDLYKNIYKFKANPITLFRIENEIW